MRQLDVRVLPPRDQHPTIHRTFDGLAAGEQFELINDHNPKPLFYEFQAERHGQFTWQPLEEGPVVWRIAIGKP